MRKARYEESMSSFSLSVRTCLETAYTGLNLEFRTENSVPKHLRYAAAKLKPIASVFGGLDVACWPLVPKFEVSNPSDF